MGERESVNWRISSRHFSPPVYSFPRPHYLPLGLQDAFCIFVCSFLQGCVPLGWSGSGSVIRVHSDHGRSNEPMNPLWTRIHRFIWSTMIQMISDHWFWSGSYQRNVPQNLPIELELKVRSIGMIRVRTSDPRSLGAQHIKVIDKSTLGNDSSVPSMLHGPSDLWSLILVGIFPKERIVALKVKARDAENLFTCILYPFQKKGAYAKATFGCEIVNIWNK